MAVVAVAPLKDDQRVKFPAQCSQNKIKKCKLVLSIILLRDFNRQRWAFRDSSQRQISVTEMKQI